MKALALLLAVAARAEEPHANFWLRPVAIIAAHLYEGPFREPTGVFFDTVANELLVADTKNNLIGIFTASGAPLFSFGRDELVREPVKVVTDAHGRIYLLDSDRTSLKIFNYRGELVSRRLELPGIAAPMISALAADSDGNLYVGEHSTCQVLVFDSALKLLFKFGARGTESGQFLSIAGIVADDAHLYVTDHQAKPVQVFSRRGSFIRSWGKHEMGVENFSLPEGIALDAAGRVIVIDALRHEIKFFDPDGTFLARFGGLGVRPGQVSFPRDVAVDLLGRIYVSERAGDRVQVFVEEPLPTPKAPK